MLLLFRKPIIPLCFLALFIQELSADSFRCGRKLISAGDSAGDLVRVCGEPNHKGRGKETIRVNGVAKETSVEHWYYRRSSRSLEHIIIIYKGRVAAVEVGHR
jgi:hypothetical protein